MSRIETIGNATLSIKAGRKRALRMYPDIGPCTECGASKAERHHRDENTANNTPENIAFLCRRCHMESDGRLVALAALASTRSTELIAAAAAEKNSRTHCKRGHPLYGENLFITSQGSRGCKECRKLHKAAYLERKA